MLFVLLLSVEDRNFLDLLNRTDAGSQDLLLDLTVVAIWEPRGFFPPLPPFINGEQVMAYQYGYELLDRSMNRVIVHYLVQDERLQPSEPHGSVKEYATGSYICTMPFVLKEIAEQKYDHPSTVYQKK